MQSTSFDLDHSNTRGAKAVAPPKSYEAVSTTSMNSNFIYKPHTDDKLEPTNCSQLLNKYRSGQIQQTNQASASYPIDKSYVTRSNTENAFQISVHAPNIDSMRHDIFKSGIYYENIMSNVIADMFSQANKDKPKVMLDVGANVGWFSLLAASHGAEVFSFEPNVINMVRFCESQMLNGWSLAENVERNNRIHSYMKGVGSQHGQSLNMYAPDPNNPGSHTFNQELAKDHFTKRKAEGDLQKLDGGELPIIALDALARDQGWLSEGSNVKIVLMKMDIEGMEPVALEGTKELLRANIIENILMEFNSDSPRADWVSLISTLFDCGYKLYKIGDHTGPNELFQLTSNDPKVVLDDFKKRHYSASNMNAWFKVKS
jgi:FkbM family methyltransferase